MFSKRVLSISESPIRKFTSHSLQAKAAGKRVIPLNIGQPDIETPQAYFDAIAAVEPCVVAYTPSNGIDELLDAFASYYEKKGMPFRKEDLLITNGGSEALSFTFSCLCDFEDEVLVFEPYCTNYNTISKVVGVNLEMFNFLPLFELGLAWLLPTLVAIVACLCWRVEPALLVPAAD